MEFLRWDREARARAEEKEKEYREEIKQLQKTITTLVLDLKILQASIPNWSSLQSQSVPTGTTDSYADVAARGVPLTDPNHINTPTRSATSRVPFNVSEQGDHSPVRSPPKAQ
jgi:hypothetical protein